MSGYVRIHRSLIGHPAFRNDAEAMVFAWMVMRAAWKPVRVRYKERGIYLDRGQLAISVRDFAAAHERNKNWVTRILKRMRDEGMIETDAGTGVLVITICNYDEYQSDQKATGTAQGTDAGQTRDTEQGSEKGKNISSEPKGSSPRAWACPVGVNPQVWTDLLANRKRKRLSNTPTAWKAFCDDLARVSAQTGIPPPKLIELCTAKGWGAIYDPRNQRDERSDNPTGTALARVQAAIRSGGTFG
jgi:hypothetical protein